MSGEDEPDVEDLLDQLEHLEETVDAQDEREQVRKTLRLAMRVSESGRTFGQVVTGFDRADLSEALLGSVLFGIPMAVEGGTEEVGAYLADRPIYLAATGLFAVGITIGLLYVADIQDVRVQRRILGLVPHRLAGILGVSFLTAVAILTVWGRISWGVEPWVSLATVVVAFVPMSIGAALGDLLPGS